MGMGITHDHWLNFHQYSTTVLMQGYCQGVKVTWPTMATNWWLWWWEGRRWQCWCDGDDGKGENDNGKDDAKILLRRKSWWWPPDTHFLPFLRHNQWLPSYNITFKRSSERIHYVLNPQKIPRYASERHPKEDPQTSILNPQSLILNPQSSLQWSFKSWTLETVPKTEHFHHKHKHWFEFDFKKRK